MKKYSATSGSILGFLLLFTAFYSCQKETSPNSILEKPDTSSGEVQYRADYMYGVTVFAPGNPSVITTIIPISGGAVIAGPVYKDLGGGQIHVFEDLKGVCLVRGQVFVTTGPSEVDAYNNALLKVDPFTGEAGVISNSDIGTISDIDYDEATGTIYGLRNNTNSLVAITDNNNNWGTYTAIGAITNLGGDFVAKGLSLVRDNAGTRIVVAATSPSGGSAQLYSVPPTAGAATFLSVVAPANQLGGGHCGIGFDLEYNIMAINRRPTTILDGLNVFGWSNPLPNPVNSIVWDEQGFNYEDLSTSLE